jgi:hypothetical protein
MPNRRASTGEGFGRARVQVSRDVVFRELEGEVVLLHLGTGVYFGLDPVGTRVWQLLAEGRSHVQVLDVLVDEYDVGERRAAADLEDFIAELREHGLVDVDAGAAR